MLEVLLTPEALVALVTLTALEIVLGIDNIIFIAILSAKLPAHQQHKARQIGLLLAMVQRILLLLIIGWVMKLDAIRLFDWGAIVPDWLMSPPTHPTAEIATSATSAAADSAAHAAPQTDNHAAGDQVMSIKELILLLGGLFLIAKSTLEIHHKLEGDPEKEIKARPAASFNAIIGQILLLDMVFSIDSVLTAVGITKHVPVMVIAVIVSVIVMMVAAGPIAKFVNKHPTVKMLALAVLMMIGVLLVAEGLEFHFPRGYLYFAMLFAFVVEMLNIKTKKGAGPGH
jgi:predicted tellurium resistance membrane protein TerC